MAQMQHPETSIVVTEEYKKVEEYVSSGERITFINGKAGTGKSTLINILKQKLKKKNIVVLAPTGVAAMSIHGGTIHSFFRFPPALVNPRAIKKVPNNEMYKNVDIIIIDEISMVRADLLDGIDIFLQINGKDSSAPFGGVQMVFVGDLMQLPPVVKDKDFLELKKLRYRSQFFFSAKCLEIFPMKTVELTQVFRQHTNDKEDNTFVKVLNAFRQESSAFKAVDWINERCYNPEVLENHEYQLVLTTTNEVASKVNQRDLAKLPGWETTYEGLLTGDFKRDDDSLPSPLQLKIKKGAMVMFTKNDEGERWVNGTLGEIDEIAGPVIKVRILSKARGNSRNQIVEVKKVEWESTQYRYDSYEGTFRLHETGRYVQYPLKLAWANPPLPMSIRAFSRVNP